MPDLATITGMLNISCELWCTSEIIIGQCERSHCLTQQLSVYLRCQAVHLISQVIQK